jgi:hypothetical protein
MKLTLLTILFEKQKHRCQKDVKEAVQPIKLIAKLLGIVSNVILPLFLKLQKLDATSFDPAFYGGLRYSVFYVIE